MEEINEAIRTATNTEDRLEQKSKFKGFKRTDKLVCKDFDLIDIEAIKPDIKSIEDHEKKFKEILGNF